MPERHVLFIDDEAYRTRLYRLNLERNNWVVHYCSTLDEADEFLAAPPTDSVAALVIDMQIGTGAPVISPAELSNAMGLAGLAYLKKRRPVFAGKKWPVAILTQITRADLRDVLESDVQSDSYALGMYRKLGVGAQKFPQLLDDLCTKSPGEFVCVE